jgi:hypothetical protein
MKLGRFFTITAMLCALTADAATQRSFVSAATGNDANPCSRPLPCRNFAAALLQTLPNGEVLVLDSGGYGAITVTQAVALEADGVVAAVAMFPAQNGVTINAGGGDAVIIRGLTINGLGGMDGFQFNSGLSLSIADSFVMRGTGLGVNALSPGSRVYVKDSTFIANNTGGVSIQSPTSFITKGVVEHVRVEGMQNSQISDSGVFVGQNAQVTVRDSVLASTYYGAFAYTTANGTAAIGMLENTLVAANFYGVYSSNGIIIVSRPKQSDAVVPGPIAYWRVSNCTIVHNNQGVSGGNLTRVNNTLNDNVTDGSFAGSYPAQ